MPGLSCMTARQYTAWLGGTFCLRLRSSPCVCQLLNLYLVMKSCFDKLSLVVQVYESLCWTVPGSVFRNHHQKPQHLRAR